MLEDIKEQPEIIKKLTEKYMPLNKPVQNISLNIEDLSQLSKIYIVASGSSRNVANIAKYFIEKYAKLSVEVDYASEFAHRNPCLSKNDLVIAVSQSGETGDTFSALKIAKNKGAYTFALTNNPESRIHNLAESKMQVGAGKEKSIAATKSFTAQLINLYALALYLGEQRNTIFIEKAEEFKREFHKIPEKIEKLIENIEKFRNIAAKIKDSRSIVLLGRAANSASAMEGALKIKETSYIDANGYPAGEFLHGYIALLDENIPVISIITSDDKNNFNYRLAIRNTEEIKRKRNPHLIIIKSQNDKEIESHTLFENADFINIPEISEEISPLLAVISLQLLAFAIAKALGRDLDKPRGLTKTITDE